MIRFFDFFFSIIGLLILSPVFLILIIWIAIDSPGPVFYRQMRVGRFAKDFKLYKFRSMYINSDKTLQLTVGRQDSRITRSGLFIRKYKLDELPQLFNVLTGDMSIVGPRPEVRKYVNLYTEDQKRILLHKPGITDYASVIFINENDILENVNNPEDFYISTVMPEKLRLNMDFIRNKSVANYFKIIFMTIFRALNIPWKSEVSSVNKNGVEFKN